MPLFASFLALAVAQQDVAASVYKAVLPSVMTLEVKTRKGEVVTATAFHALKEGYALTCWHAVRDAASVTVKFADGEEYEATGIVDKDEKRDLAILRTRAIGKPLLSIADKDPEVGQRIFVIGSPQGLDFSVSEGLISSIRALDGFRQYQFSASASPGNSGGPLLDAKGNVLGIVAWQLAEGQNLNFAVPALYAKGLDLTLPTTSWGTVASTPDGGSPQPGAEADEVDEEVISTMAAALKQLWKFAIRLHIDTENVMGKTSIATPMLNEEIIRLRFERGRLDEMEGEGDLPVLAQYLATMLELAAVTGDQLKECSQYADRSVFPNSVVTEYVTSFRFTEVDDAFRKSAIEGEYDGLKRACGDSLFEKIFAKREQQGWMPGDMSRISRQRFEGGYRLLSRLAYDIDSTGYVLGFLVDPENPARLYEVMNETPPKSWGFAKGDIVQEINGISVDSFESMKKFLLAQKEKQVTVTVLRNRKPKQLKVDARKWM